MLATLVTILTLGAGPLPAKPERHAVVPNTTIKVFRDVGAERRPYAELYEGGELTMRLRSGFYSIEAKLDTTSNLEAARPCYDVALNESIVNVRVGHRKTQRIKFVCSAP